MQTSIAPLTNPIPGQYWQWRGHKVYYVQAGEPRVQRPPLLLVHGFGASTDHWRKNITELSADFQVFAIDLLGFGRSAKPKLQYSADLWQDQLHDFINQVIGQKTILAGNSLGGYACLCVAAQRCDSAAGVVLLNSAGPFSPAENQIQPAANPLKKLLGNAIKWCFKKRLAQSLLFEYTRQKWVIRRTLEKVYLDKNAVTDQLVAEIQRPAYDPGALDVFISVFSTPQGEKVDVLLKQLNCPLLLLWGEADPWMKARERSQKFHEYYPQLTEYFLIAGHCPHDEIPEQVNRHLRNWVISLH
ncbi:alpha/beta fold hydrolase [Dolichospermum flos-aquae]|uniref:Alpha/beta fold hydrolase n=1 Tax=Dolichospermum flos-aquae LEGE 04289 TaxID=1828708 RepID=A0ACC5Q633_DOLFA|nr:alpha/beta fold hydrolase [Dolichospermum flos-aquae]MBE9220127.1 alpha/beta fold hydrolase [Dolichospermum flos-aquae LEGE 04289]